MSFARDVAAAVLHHIGDALVRVPALEHDLAALLAADRSTVVSPSPSTLRYCDRMREVSFS